ncbi:MAG: hypothetical protein EBT13_00385 [Rhodobacteraceae bacterium]|nr:hypothetical protein [Paracoccaceae bacterium]
MAQTQTLTYNDRASWLETIWDVIHDLEDRTKLVTHNEDDIKTAMAWITEALGMENTADGIVSIEQAECARNGHRDDGRGCCADCGEFI